nr:MAG TPA: hypothetical protein [Caudoviricetes sp.]
MWISVPYADSRYFLLTGTARCIMIRQKKAPRRALC